MTDTTGAITRYQVAYTTPRGTYGGIVDLIEGYSTFEDIRKILAVLRGVPVEAITMHSVTLQTD